MAHFAKINSENTVTQVIVVSNDNAPDEKTGQEYIALIGLEGTWLQTSYNTFGGQHLLGGTPFRKNYAGIGMTYDPVRNAFIPQKPYSSFVLNEETCLWENLVPKPEGSATTGWVWNENTLSWEVVPKSVE
jgi:hypothetical protein